MHNNINYANNGSFIWEVTQKGQKYEQNNG